MLTPDFLLHIADKMTLISDDIETYVLSEIIKRLVARAERGEELMFTPYDKYQINALEESGKLYNDIVKKLSELSGEGIAEIKDALMEAGVTSIVNDALPLYRNGLPFDVLFPNIPMESIEHMDEVARILLNRSPAYIRIMEASYNATAGTFTNLVQTQAYASRAEFVNACDRAYWKAVSGSVSYTKAIQEEVQALKDNGIRAIQSEESGRWDKIDVAMARALRTGVSKMTAEITLARCKELGIDTVLVDAHIGSRPEHEVWQGKIYSLSGTSDKYADFVESTGYGTGEGLCGWNCRHSFTPFMEGMSNPYESAVDKEENEKRYALEQKQRYMERNIRKIKRDIELTKQELSVVNTREERLKLNEQIKSQREKLKACQNRYVQFCEENNLRVMSERLVA